jgi:hypothetical protein
MLKLLPMREPKRRKASEWPRSCVEYQPSPSEPEAGSCSCRTGFGVPAGSEAFYNAEVVNVIEQDARDKPLLTKPIECTVPSTLLLWALVVGACSGELGLHLTQATSATRSAKTPPYGLIACATAFALAWLFHVRAWS